MTTNEPTNAFGPVDLGRFSISRRAVMRRALAGAGALGVATTTGWRTPVRAGGLGQGTPTAALLPSLTIDLAAEPPTLDPALVYDADGWSVIHSVYDALVQYGADGQLQPLLAESLRLIDPRTYEIKLRQNILFHNGEPFDARSVSASVAHIVDPATASQVAQLFAVIEGVEEVDPHTVRFHLSRPAPWLPAQMAPWLVMAPPALVGSPDLASKPIGTGPYRFTSWDRGERITLTVNEAYALGDIKGTPIATEVAYRFVPAATTRVADLVSGGAGLIRNVPVDQVATVKKEATVTEQPVSGSAWIRIPTDVEPFSDVRVRQALNAAVDVETIIQALLDGAGSRLPNFFVEGGLGFDPALTAIPYDPDRARALLAEAGLSEGFETALAYTNDERDDVVTAIAGQLADVGIRATLQPVEKATFNATWTDPKAAPLRFSTWRPLFDPYTLLDLVFSEKGYLSRHNNPTVQALIDAAAVETDDAKRSAAYQRLGAVLRDEPAAIYLYNLTARYGVDSSVATWSPRPDDYIIPTVGTR